MFLRCFRAEDRKLHASPIWILFFLLPVISAVYGTFNYLQNLGILEDQWYSLWTQHTLFYALFFYHGIPALLKKRTSSNRRLKVYFSDRHTCFKRIAYMCGNAFIPAAVSHIKHVQISVRANVSEAGNFTAALSYKRIR